MWQRLVETDFDSRALVRKRAGAQLICRQTFTHALYHIAANPDLLIPLREEVERVLAEEGWSKAGMAKMRRIDSIMKESLRLNGIHQCESPFRPRIANSL